MRFDRLVLIAVLATTAAPGFGQDRYWQCAAFAREFSGLQIRADALDWWAKADGRYRRGYAPRVGAVMALVPSGPMRLGHVATVTVIEGPRDIRVTHANWSPIDGVRGQIEYDVAVRDVSDANDWSRVRVWYAPLADLGTTAWPVQGFIYPERIGSDGHTDGYSASRVPLLRSRTLPIELLAGNSIGPPRASSPLRGPLVSREVLRLARLEAGQR